MAKKAAMISIEMPISNLEKVKSFYDENKKEAPTQYIGFFAKLDNVSVSIYNKVRNGNVKIVFSGEQAEDESKIWLSLGGIPVQKKTENIEKKPQILDKEPKKAMKNRFNNFPQIGSDEVGTGDYFGPICVCAAYVNEEGLARLNTLGITDSKKMRDEYILQVGPTLISSFKYSQLSLDNKKYNELIKKGENINTIKAKMHNRCLYNLHKKYPTAKLCQDQFVSPTTYYKYLKDEEIVVRDIEFSTKGELAFPSVALASCIARYSFLTKMKKLGEKYKVEFPLGASAAVDEFAKRLVKKYGESILEEVAKFNFANTKKIQ